ncbi:MAG: hypothetical protein LBJ67_06800 [Planctomycetaceae bacterium]|jgi:glucuronokinase|nr:hypothetical protein [Planctomycetaceae bacterium]
MELIRRRAYARAGLMGNPSDGYHGKTISVIVKNHWAQVTLYEWDRLEIVASQNDISVFRNIHDLATDVRLHGYYGGVRLIKAAIKGFCDYCAKTGRQLKQDNFSIRYESNIPRQVGLAGSSAIIVAAFRCLIDFYGVDIPQNLLPSLVLSIERDELGITAGLQDRVVQVFEGMVFMDFSCEAMCHIDGFECGKYEPFSLEFAPPLYIAYSSDAGEPTEVFHNNLRARFENGETVIVNAMQQFAQYAQDAKKAIYEKNYEKLAKLINANFDLRHSICHLPKEHVEMIETARAAGASAKFAGSGGAIVGTYPNEEIFQKLKNGLNEIGCIVVKPTL